MLNWKAVILGAIVDFVGTDLATLALAMLWMAALSLSGASGDVRELTFHSPLFLAVSMTVGWYFDYLGGKVAGSLAGEKGALHGLTAAMPGVVLALVEAADPGDLPFPVWFTVLACAVSIGCACYGGARAVSLKKN